MSSSKYAWCKFRRCVLFLGGLIGLGWQTTAAKEKDPELMATFQAMIAAGAINCGEKDDDDQT